MPSLTIQNCVYNGLNGSTVASSVTTGSLTLGGAVGSFVKGNGSLDNSTYLTAASITAYPTMATVTDIVTSFSGGAGGTVVNATIGVRRMTNGTQTMITLLVPQIVANIGPTAVQFLSATAIVPVGVRPSAYVLLPVPFRQGSVWTFGVLWVYPNGFLQISAVDQSNAPANTLNYGVSVATQVSYYI